MDILLLEELRLSQFEWDLWNSVLMNPSGKSKIVKAKLETDITNKGQK